MGGGLGLDLFEAAMKLWRSDGLRVLGFSSARIEAVERIVMALGVHAMTVAWWFREVPEKGLHLVKSVDVVLDVYLKLSGFCSLARNAVAMVSDAS